MRTRGGTGVVVVMVVVVVVVVMVVAAAEWHGHAGLQALLQGW